MNTAQRSIQTLFRGYSRVLPGLAAESARKLMMTPRIPAGLRTLHPDLVDETIPLCGDAHLSIVRGGPRTALLIHGWSSGPGQFVRLIEALRRNDFTIYMVHPEGHGPSHARESHPGKFIQALNDTLALIDGPVGAAIGHSMGAGVLTHVAARHGNIRKLVLISGPSSFEGVLRRTAQMFQLGTKAEAAFLDRTTEVVGIPLPALDLVREGKKIDVPTLIVHDRNDREIPYSDAEQLHNAINGSRLLTTEGLGHRRILHRAELMQEVARFALAPSWFGQAAEEKATGCA